MKSALLFTLVLLIYTTTSCKKENEDKDDVEVVSATGDIRPGMDQFRELLGPLNTGSAASTGRREINWDGVPEDMLGQPLPDDFFNPTGATAVAGRQRGLVYTSRLSTFVVSKKNFEEINTLAASNFKPFSGTNTFANTSSSLWEVGFQVPGRAVKAGVRGFGAVFSDVDRRDETYLELFDEDQSLGTFFVPPHDGSTSFSFLGIYFRNARKITRVVVSHPALLVSGTADISQGGPDDLIVLDDFIYSEPVE